MSMFEQGIFYFSFYFLNVVEGGSRISRRSHCVIILISRRSHCVIILTSRRTHCVIILTWKILLLV